MFSLSLPFFSIFIHAIAEAAVLDGFVIQRDSKNMSSLTLSWRSDQDNNCLYNNPFYTAKVFLSWAGTNNSNCTAASFNSSTDVTKTVKLALQDKEYYVAYCILTKYQLTLTYDTDTIISYNESVHVPVSLLSLPTISSYGGECVCRGTSCVCRSSTHVQGRRAVTPSFSPVQPCLSSGGSQYTDLQKK